jgi:hypothetical protein
MCEHDFRSSRFLVRTEWPSDATPPTILYVCGYRRTGKDTFVRELALGEFAYGKVRFPRFGRNDPPFLSAFSSVQTRIRPR